MQQFLDIFSENFSVAVVALAALLFSLIELRWPNKAHDFSWRWNFQAVTLALLGVFFTILTGSGFESQLQSVHLIALPGTLPDWAGGFAAYLVVTFFVYWWHRARHASNLLWRVFHQIHHSPHRIQALTAFYAHPADFLCNTLIVNLVAYPLLGLSVAGAAWAALWVGLFEIWEHVNIRTPRWLGYIIVRPEMHRIHHEREKHLNNYGLPVWDMIFGTYENSMRQVECGFAPALEQRLLPMLMTRDVHQPD
jgi:sterol desaturase/sphingolipid hydroxylase (fatty acid hydroxylase superfamily)